MSADVLVVGGGPAGSSTARWLAERGFEVLLLERTRFPRRKVCGEYLNPGAVAALERAGVRSALAPFASPLRGVRLVPPGAPSVELSFPGEAMACPRDDLDAVLLDRAVAAGVRVERGRVEELVHESNRCAGVLVRNDDGELVERRARIVVAADGAGSIVARKLGLTRPLGGTRRFAIGGHYTGFGSLDGFVEMYVGANAYFAINPLGAARANVMVVVPQASLGAWSRDVDDGVRGVAAALGRGHRSFAGAQRIGERVSVGPLAHAVRAPFAPGALLVGDAAGFLNPFTGQGVFLALTGAEAAAAAIADALHLPAREGARFHAYARAREADFAARKRLSALVGLLIDVAPLARRTVARLRAMPHRGAALIDALAGVRSPQSAFDPRILAGLIV